MFEAFPRVRILFENGGGADPGAPTPRFEADFGMWPVTSGVATWYFGPKGTLQGTFPPAAGSADSYVYDPSHQHDTTLATDNQAGPWAKLPDWQWKPPAAPA